MNTSLESNKKQIDFIYFPQYLYNKKFTLTFKSH